VHRKRKSNARSLQVEYLLEDTRAGDDLFKFPSQMDESEQGLKQSISQEPAIVIYTANA
jgi:hypothetical protein